MDTLTLQYVYYGHTIKQSLQIDDLVDMINQLNPAQRMRIKMKLLESIMVFEKLEPFQMAVLKKHLNEVERVLEWVEE